MLKASRRLRAEDVKRVLTQGRSVRSGVLSAKYVASASPLRSAAVVSKKLARSAVARNRLRRALYRALTPLSGRGELVIFVQVIPALPLTPAFAIDIAELLKKISQK